MDVPKRIRSFAASFQGVEECSDVARILRRDAHLRHGIAGQRPLRILDPPRHVFRRIAEEAGDVGPGSNMQQRRTNVAGCVDDAGNQMAAAAAILFYQNHPALGIAGKVLAFFASLIAASLPVSGFLIWWGRKKG